MKICLATHALSPAVLRILRECVSNLCLPEYLRHSTSMRDALLRQGCETLGEVPKHQIEAAINQFFSGKEKNDGGEEAIGANALLGVLNTLREALFVSRRGYPTLDFDALLDFQRVSASVFPDQLFCFALAHTDANANSGMARQRSAQELSALFADGLYPPVDNAVIEALRHEGLAEVHRHHNGSALPALLWHRLVIDREQIGEIYGHGDFASGYSGRELYAHLLAAGHLRNAMLSFLLRNVKDEQFAGDWSRQVSERFAWLEGMGLGLPVPEVCRNAWAWMTRDRAEFLPGGTGGDAVARERAFLTAAFRHLLLPLTSETGGILHARTLFELTLHAYLVIQNMTLRELQQPRENARGFERFDTYSQSCLRRVAENSSADRVRQSALSGGVKWLEVRLAPKDSVDGLNKQLSGFYPPLPLAWELPVPIKKSCCPMPPSPVKIGIVYHFIREKDHTRNSGGSFSPTPTRHAELRRKVWAQARALDRLRLHDPNMCSKVLGLDVANAETNTPPEVFAPAIRALRSQPANLHWQQQNSAFFPGATCGVAPWGLTFHAGEDFRHLLSGMRSVDEAVRFLDMGSGDRIGHGVALGLEPLMWIKRQGGFFYMPQQEWLDNLVWFRNRLSAIPNSSEIALIVERQICHYSSQIYLADSQEKTQNIPYHWDLLHHAWEMRYQDPLGLDRGMQGIPGRIACEGDDAAHCFFYDYHFNSTVRANGNKPVTIMWERKDWPLWAEAIRFVQDELLRELKQHGIAIEANPTSNLTICPIDRMEDHPIFRWHPPEKDQAAIRPFVIVGSDDPGIFATELIYEYAYLARAAESRGAEQREIRDWLRELRQTSIDYCFVK